MKYEISKEKLVAILELAFEEGCYGYLDLKSSVIEKIMDDLQLAPTFDDPVSSSSSASDVGNFIFAVRSDNPRRDDEGSLIQTQNLLWEDYNNADETTLIRTDGPGFVTSTIVSSSGSTIQLADLPDTNWQSAGDG